MKLLSQIKPSHMALLTVVLFSASVFAENGEESTDIERAESHVHEQLSQQQMDAIQAQRQELLKNLELTGNTDQNTHLHSNVNPGHLMVKSNVCSNTAIPLGAKTSVGCI